MKHRTEKKTEWQSIGGSFEIPDGWCVTKVNFDVGEPYVIITEAKTMSDEKRLLIPKSLAYYLSTHFCGSNVMRELIQEHTRHEMRQSIKEILGL